MENIKKIMIGGEEYVILPTKDFKKIINGEISDDEPEISEEEVEPEIIEEEPEPKKKRGNGGQFFRDLPVIMKKYKVSRKEASDILRGIKEPPTIKEEKPKEKAKKSKVKIEEPKSDIKEKPKKKSIRDELREFLD